MLLLTHYIDTPKATEIYEKLQELKQVVACERKQIPLEMLATFPDSPDELPEGIFQVRICR